MSTTGHAVNENGRHVLLSPDHPVCAECERIRTTLSAEGAAMSHRWVLQTSLPNAFQHIAIRAETTSSVALCGKRARMGFGTSAGTTSGTSRFLGGASARSARA